LYNPGRFRIEEVEVRGKFERVDPEMVRQSVAGELDGNYFSASLEAIEVVIREQPWVFEATVRRRWPSTLVVEVDEVQPIAAWGEGRWLNATGDLVKQETWDGVLPILHGPDEMKDVIWRSFQQWHGLFAAQGLSLDRLVFDERELWYLTLSLSALAVERNALPAEVDAGAPLPAAEVTMIVDNIDAEARIRRLISALNSQLIAEFPGMRSIDLRYPNGFAINWIEGAPAANKLTESN
jgi:cell division protein FtsQ